jgi:GrpB-like predicted nucleotidyltransferase (UPF0157 family)
MSNSPNMPRVFFDSGFAPILAFRDHLKQDAPTRAAFAKVKIDLAPSADVAGYAQAKAAFIESVRI